VFAVPPVVLFSDADVAHHPLYLLQLTSVQFSVADPGSGIRCLFDPWIRDPVPFWPLDPGSGMGKKIRTRIRDEQPWSYFRELRKNFGVKILNFFLCGSGMEKIRIQDKHPGSTTLVQFFILKLIRQDFINFFTN
jgi:hypothetical protein